MLKLQKDVASALFKIRKEVSKPRVLPKLISCGYGCEVYRWTFKDGLQRILYCPLGLVNKERNEKRGYTTTEDESSPVSDKPMRGYLSREREAFIDWFDRLDRSYTPERVQEMIFKEEIEV